MELFLGPMLLQPATSITFPANFITAPASQVTSPIHFEMVETSNSEVASFSGRLNKLNKPVMDH